MVIPVCNDERELKALNELKLTHSGQVVIAYFRTRLDVLRKSNDQAEGVQLARQQGGCQVLQQVLDDIDGAIDALRRKNEQPVKHSELY